MKTRYVKTALSGGGATALDGIVITTPLLTDDFAFVVVGNVATMYNFDAASNEAESLPDIVNPDGNGGAGRWILQNLRSTGFTGTSATSLLIETASKTLTTQTNKAFVIGMSVKIADSAAPSTNWMHGDITSYTASTGVLIVSVTKIGGSGTKTAWTVSLSAPILEADVPSGAKMLFYADTAPVGWTLLNTLNDKVVYVTKGSVAGGQTGGAVHSAGTWTQPPHVHTNPSHTHTGPSHQHNVSGNTGAADAAVQVASGALDASTLTHDHVININTNLAGTEATGLGGFGSTGSQSTVNTWRPAAFSMIMCSKD